MCKPICYNHTANEDGGRSTKAHEKVNSWNPEIRDSLGHGSEVLWHSYLDFLVSAEELMPLNCGVGEDS